jgi:hypothetical protein
MTSHSFGLPHRVAGDAQQLPLVLPPLTGVATARDLSLEDAVDCLGLIVGVDFSANVFTARHA